MSQPPPHNHASDLTEDEMKRVRRIAQKTGKTVEQVIAAAIGRGTSAAFADVLSGRAPARNPG